MKKQPAQEDPAPFRLERGGADSIPLSLERPFSIGRASECDLCIPSSRVSRLHCELRLEDEGPLLRDLGSINGTLVNGTAIHGDLLLQDGDELEIGPFLCVFRSGSGQDAFLTSLLLTQPVEGQAMRGDLSQVELPLLLSSLWQFGHRGCLEVFNADDQGLVLFEGERLTYAEAGPLRGEEALRALLLFKDGSFCLTLNPDLEEPANLHRPLQELLTDLRAPQG